MIIKAVDLFCGVGGLTYGLQKAGSTLRAVKRNLLKIFPLVNKDFRIHLYRGTEVEIIEDFDKEMISELSL